ncbi:hypothetical protein KJ641_00010 [Patescibacteria group bacterium]|nr:hypothetical protein [Patescibacteria group bacterium]
MKKCSKCSKTYDNTWEVCLGCKVKLDEIATTEEQNQAIQKEVESKNLDLEHIQTKKASLGERIIASLGAIVFGFIFLIFFKEIVILMLSQGWEQSASLLSDWKNIFGGIGWISGYLFIIKLLKKLRVDPEKIDDLQIKKRACIFLAIALVFCLLIAAEISFLVKSKNKEKKIVVEIDNRQANRWGGHGKTNKYWVANFDNENRAEKFAQDLKKAILSKNKEEVSNMLSYPVNVNLRDGSDRTIESKEAFLMLFDNIFYSEFIESFKTSDTKDMYATYQGVRISSENGSYYIWFSIGQGEGENRRIGVEAIFSDADLLLFGTDVAAINDLKEFFGISDAEAREELRKFKEKEANEKQ